MAVTATDPTNSLPEVHVLSAMGDFLHIFKVVHETNRSARVIAQKNHWANEHLIVVSIPYYKITGPLRARSHWSIGVFG